QNFPVLATKDNGRLRGWLSGLPAAPYHLEFFASAAHSANGSGEAEVFLGAAEVTADGLGMVTFDVPFAPVAGKPWISATATDAQGDTSELSPARRAALSRLNPPLRFRAGRP